MKIQQNLAFELQPKALQVHTVGHAVFVHSLIVLIVIAIFLKYKTRRLVLGAISGVVCCFADSSTAEVKYSLQTLVVEEVIERPDTAFLICKHQHNKSVIKKLKIWQDAGYLWVWLRLLKPIDLCEWLDALTKFRCKYNCCNLAMLIAFSISNEACRIWPCKMLVHVAKIGMRMKVKQTSCIVLASRHRLLYKTSSSTKT